MSNVRLSILHRLIVVLLLASATSVSAQSVDFVIEAVDYFADIKVEIVDYFADEKWEVVGACSNLPDVKVEFVDYFADLKVEIVDYFADRKVCVSGARYLDEDILKALHLID